MAFSPGNETDIFIAHAHQDNDEGWVDQLRESIDERLRRYLGQKAVQWQSHSIGISPAGHDDAVRQMISDVLRNSALLLIVATPRFVERVWFQIELEMFLKYHDGATHDPGSNIFLVETSPLVKQHLPSALQSIEAYSFYCEGSDGSIGRLDVNDEHYDVRLSMLCHRVAKALNQIRHM